METAPPPTRLERAFAELEEAHQILAAPDCACCSNCGHTLLTRTLEERPEFKGYCFFHGQDTDGVLEDGDLFLRFAAREDSAAGAVAVAETVVAVLLSTGLEVDWDGDPGRCIHVRIPPEDLRFFSALREEGGSGGDDDDEDDEEEEEEGEPGEGEQEMEESARGGGSSGEEAREPPLYNFRYAVSRALAGQQATLRALALQERSARRAAAPPRVPYASEAYELA